MALHKAADITHEASKVITIPRMRSSLASSQSIPTHEWGESDPIVTDLLSVYSNLQPKIIWHPDCVFCFGHAIKQEAVGFRGSVRLLILSLHVFLIS